MHDRDRTAAPAQVVPAEARPATLPAHLPALAPTRSSILALQRSAGNHAVSRLLAREPAAAPAAAPVVATGAPPGANPATGFVEYLYANDPVALVRMGLETVRVIPFVGLPAGVAADIAAGWQDLETIPSGASLVQALPIGTMIVVRTGINTVNGVLGQLSSIVELAGYTVAGFMGVTFGSTAAADIPALVALVGLHEALSIAQFDLTAWTGLIDMLTIVTTGASFALGSGTEAQQWGKLMAGYIANLVGDALALGIEWLGAITGGAFPSGMVGGIKTSLIAMLKILLEHTQQLLQWMAGMWNVIGGGAIEKVEGIELPKPPVDEGLVPQDAPPRTNLEAFSGDIGAARGAVLEGDAAVGAAVGDATELFALAAAKLEELTGQPELYEELRAAIESVAAQVDARLASVQELDGTLASGLALATAAREELAEQLALVEDAELPPLPAPPEGEGGIADAGAAAAYALATEQFATVKGALVAQLSGFAEPLEQTCAGLAGAREAATLMTEALTDARAEIGELLVQSETIPELLRSMIAELEIATDDGTTVSLADARAGWIGLLPQLDELAAAVDAKLAAAEPPPPDEAAG